MLQEEHLLALGCCQLLRSTSGGLQLLASHTQRHCL
jgi:hypothetical protein